jgi:hypothetical protein
MNTHATCLSFFAIAIVSDLIGYTVSGFLTWGLVERLWIGFSAPQNEFESMSLSP